ncbi:hypothetical protein AUEXF2481DRAFT_76199 [Aureobasidium subglaciale EXF-2481]|uniref:Uncharacterized protein n=1 Tax=Aureobasidium subglaciale (strain EXF-2481) TaxID=1043005 RepID=A0A074YPJ5_AURSE|nr:uncharacterized protein AUEXF2481DRAFT_76199 [Aureobasidium subglaciale EXF-2481]KEQ99600.1 hypothetical protein AUEXF2481DRAFT_76199 [Aureobasidium subglaciale EXF-2481]
MVLLTLTPAAKSAVDLFNQRSGEKHDDSSSDPSLSEPRVGSPVSHAQLIEVARFLRESDVHSKDDYRLDALLKGASIYVAPPKPKPQPTAEYLALMARLRREEENIAYQRMINPTTSIPEPSRIRVEDEDDEVTYTDVNRQLALIINVLVSIIACSVAIWIAARHWSVPQRMALSMFGSGTVAFAEVAIYMGYIRRIKDAKHTEKKKVETKEVVDTWVIEKKDPKKEHELRQRKGGKHR